MKPDVKQTGLTQTHINTDKKSGSDGIPRQPNERDESPEVDSNSPLRPEIKQAAADLQQGQVDTDLHGVRGVEKVVENQGNGRKRKEG